MFVVPTADALLNELSTGRRDVLQLAYHVTYWDNLGWQSAFDLAADRSGSRHRIPRQRRIETITL